MTTENARSAWTLRRRALMLLCTLVPAMTASAASLEIRFEGLESPFHAGDTVTLGVWMNDVAPASVGFQAFLEFDESQLTLVAGGYTPTPFGEWILNPIVDVGGEIDLAAGTDLLGGQLPVTGEHRLATLTFLINNDLCIPPVAFRPHDPPSRLSDGVGHPILPLDLIAFPLPPCPGDIDANGEVGFSDLLIVLSAWGEGCPGDVDQSGLVNFADLIIVLDTWGPC